MLKFLVPLFAVVSMVSCKEVTQPIVCDAQKFAVNKVANVFSANLECANIAAMEADLNKQLESLKLCAPAGTIATQSSLPSLICPAAVNYVVGFGVGKLPSTWECKGGLAADKLSSVLLNSCLKIPL